MNKLIKTIFGAALGLTMTFGVGAAILNNNRGAMTVHADRTGTATQPGNTAISSSATDMGGDANVKIMTSSANSYTSPLRIYANTTITITAQGAAYLTSVVYNASSTGSYVTNAQNATVSPSVTPTVSNKAVTWTFSGTSTTEFTFRPDTQTRADSIVAHYTVPSNKTLSDISITTEPTKTTYYVGESFDSTGMVVEASYSDSSTEDVTSSCTFLPDSFSATGTQNVTVSYTDGEITKTATQSVTVKAPRTITGVALTGDMTKKSYSVGDSWDYAGLEVTVSYNEGSPDIVSLNAAIANGDIEVVADPVEPTLGTTSITLKEIEYIAYNGEISNKTVSGITVASAPSNFTWNLAVDSTSSADEELITWTNNYATMSATNGTTTAANNYYPGKSNYTSTRFYGGSTLTISPKLGVEITKVEMNATTTGYATDFGNSWTNASSTTSDTLITITPTDGKNAFSHAVPKTAGFSSVKVYYYSKMLSSVTWSGTPVSPQYVGDSFNYSGLTFVAHFDDESSENVAGSDISWNALAAGNNPTGSYNDKTVTITGVSVLANTLNSISISGDMTKTEYTVGSAWNPSGLVVTASFLKGPKLVTEDVEWSFSPTSPTDDTESVVVTATYTSDGVTKTASTAPIAITIAETAGLLKSGYYYITATNENIYYLPQGEKIGGSAGNLPAASEYNADVYGVPYYFDLIADNTYTISYLNSSNKRCYLNLYAANTGTKVTELEEITDACKWTLSANGDGYYKLTANDGTDDRNLSLYKKQDWRTYKSDTADSTDVLSIVSENDKFANDFVGTYTASCDASGSYTSLDWTKAKNHFDSLHNSSEFTNADYSVSGSGNATVVTKIGETRQTVAEAVAKYDYIVSKYNTTSVTTFEEFMGRVESGKISYSARSNNLIDSITGSESSAAIIIVSMVGLTAAGYFFLRRRKEQH